MESRSDLSKQYLSEAMLALLKNHEYTDITIQDIVEKAGLSRMAYYRNFHAKDEILKYYLDQITDFFILEEKPQYDPSRFRDYVFTLFSHLTRQKELGALLLKAGLIHFVWDEFNRIFDNKSTDEREHCHNCFLAGGLYNIYVRWLETGCKASPEEIADMLADFFEGAVS